MGWFSKKQTLSTDNIEVQEKDDIEVVKDPTPPVNDELEKIRKETAEAIAARDKEIERWKLEAEQAKRQTNETQDQLTTETDNRFKAEEIAIANAITAASSEADRIQRDLVKAQEEGRFEEAAKHQRDLSSAQFKIDEWSNRKSNLESEKKNVKAPQKVSPSQDEVIARELEKYNQYPVVKEWLRNNNKFFTDPRFRAKVDAAHYDAEEEGYRFGTQEYRDFVDNAINGEKAEPKKAEVKKQEISKKPPAVPPSRRSSMNEEAPTKESIHLTAEEVEYAQIANPQLFAKDRNKAIALWAASQKALVEQGKIKKWTN